MEDNLNKGAHPKLFHFARLNRKAQTQAEQILWEHLRDRRLAGFKFRRQHPIGDFIADFFCLECNLVIEVDGKYHHDSEQTQQDIGRTFELNELNIRVIRFSNEEVIDNLDQVLSVIVNILTTPDRQLIVTSSLVETSSAV